MKDPAPLYFSLITGIYDEYLQKYVAANNVQINPDALWQAGMAIARKVHELVKERNYPCGFIGGGARGLHHFTEMVGADASITINWAGTADKLIEQNSPVVARFFQPTPASVEDELLEKLEDHRKAFYIHGIKPSEYEDYGPVELFRSNFTQAWDNALERIASLR
jgi:transaldolase